MQFDMQIEEVSNSRRRIHFTVPSDEVDRELHNAYAKLRKTVRLPGFRKGTAPRWLLEKRYAKNIEADVSQQLIDQSYRQADIPLPVVSRPIVEGQPLAKKAMLLSLWSVWIFDLMCKWRTIRGWKLNTNSLKFLMMN
jgi:hypothetical protein